MSQSNLQVPSRTRKQQGKNELKPNQPLPKSAKERRTSIPPPQSQRIMQRFVAGQSIREISREEGRARETITKIVRCDEMQAHVKKMRERFYGFGCDALDAVRYALRKKKDGQLGYRFLVDIGVVPTQEERQTLTTRPVVPEKDEAERVFEWVSRLNEIARERERIFGMPMPELQVQVSLKEIRRQLNRMNGTDQPLLGFSGRTTAN